MGYGGKKAGFTLIEVVMAVAALSFIVLGLYQLPGFFRGQEKQMASVVTRDRIFKSFAQQFIQVAERADVALRFQYLPVPIACAPHSPCVQRLDNGKELKAANVPGLSNIQFFSDEAGDLTENSVFEGNTELNIFKVQSRKPLTLDASVRQEENYATWPLESPASPPFVLLTRSALNDYFFLVSQFVQSGATSRWVIVEGIRSGVPVNQLLAKPMVVYNTSDFSQYFVQKVSQAFDCTTADLPTRNSCTQAAQSILGSSYTPPATFFNSRYYALRLEEFTATDLAGFLPALSPAATPWGHQATNIFLFPTHNFSLLTHASPPSPPDTTSARIGDISYEPADTIRLGHFQDMLPPALQSKLALLPADLLAYGLEDVLDAKGKRSGRMILHMKTLGTSHSVRILEDIKDGSSIVFARRLGTTELGVFQFE